MKKYLLVLYINLLSVSVFAQLDTVFWFAAPEVSVNNNFDKPIVFRISATDNDSDIIIDQPANTGFIPIELTIPAGQTNTIDLTTWIDQIENKPANTVLDFGLRIRASTPVTAYYEVVSSFCNCNPEIFALKGQNAMGTTFYIPGQHFLNNGASYSPTPYNAFDIVASENNTEITITPSQNIVGHTAGSTFTINLNQGQTYSATATSVIANQHLHGSYVISDKPIAITVKDDLLAGSPFGGCADLAGDQNIPLSIVGKEYIAVRGNLNAPYDQVFILATENNTTVSVNGVEIVTLNQGESHNYAMGNVGSAYITASNPIYVTQLSGFGCEVGMSILPPIICTGSKQVSFSRSTAETLFLILLIPSGAEDDFTLNGNTGIINATDFQFVPGTNNEWLFAKLTIPTNIVPAGGTGVVVNTTEFFHLGIIHGSAGGGCRYGYFSDFSAFGYEISASATSVCAGNSIALTTGEIEGATYDWTGPNGFSAQGQSVTLDQTDFAQTGYYFVSGNLPDACQLLEDSIFIEVHPLPTVSDLVFQDLCDGQNVAISYNIDWNDVIGGTTTIEFGDGSENPNASSPATHTYSSFGEFTVSVTASTPAGCQDTEDMTVQVNQMPSVEISSFSYCSNSVNFESQINMGQTLATLENFYWLIDGDSLANIANPTVSVELETGIYQGVFGLTNSDGCLYTFDFEFFVDNALELDNFTLPNVISPNNDNINDYFVVDDIFNDCVPYTIEFFNRWGQLIYTMTSNDNAFAGFDKDGLKLLEGIYFYNFKSEVMDKHGIVHVILE